MKHIVRDTILTHVTEGSSAFSEDSFDRRRFLACTPAMSQGIETVVYITKKRAGSPKWHVMSRSKLAGAARDEVTPSSISESGIDTRYIHVIEVTSTRDNSGKGRYRSLETSTTSGPDTSTVRIRHTFPSTPEAAMTALQSLENRRR